MISFPHILAATGTAPDSQGATKKMPKQECWRCGYQGQLPDENGTGILCPCSAEWVEIQCVHEDNYKYPIVPAGVKHMGKKHRVKAAFSSRLEHPLTMETDWPGFDNLLGLCLGVWSQKVGTYRVCAVLAT